MPVAAQSAIAAVVVVVLLVRSVRLRPVRERAPVVLNCALLGYGALLLVSAARPVADRGAMTPSVVALLVLDLVVAVAAGAARARTITVLPGPAGRPMCRGGAATVLVWIAGLVAHLAVGFAIDHVAGTGRLGTSTILLHLGVTVIVQNALVRVRARRPGQAAAVKVGR